MAIDLKLHCEHIATLGTKQPSASARRELDEALYSKWEGVQVTAARALAAWGDEASLTAVRDLLAVLSTRPACWSAVGAIARALAPHVSVDDMEWILELFFEQCRKDNRFAMMPLLLALPRRETLLRIEARGLKSGQDMQAIQHALGFLRTSSLFGR
jgi:hypothetical protein